MGTTHHARRSTLSRVGRTRQRPAGQGPRVGLKKWKGESSGFQGSSACSGARQKPRQMPTTSAAGHGACPTLMLNSPLTCGDPGDARVQRAGHWPGQWSGNRGVETGTTSLRTPARCLPQSRRALCPVQCPPVAFMPRRAYQAQGGPWGQGRVAGTSIRVKTSSSQNKTLCISPSQRKGPRPPTASLGPTYLVPTLRGQGHEPFPCLSLTPLCTGAVSCLPAQGCKDSREFGPGCHPAGQRERVA